MSGLSEDDYKDLLKIFNKLDEDNKSKKKQGIHDYSLMNALLKKTDEVHLHSNFIYSMINPKGSHYCGNEFLKFFLDSINESDFIDIDNARAHKEKGKIDLLVEDGEHYLIIENKLSAVDQPRQISRYIHYIIKNYLDKSDEKLHEKIRVVYLSEYKPKPSIKSESIIGFELKDGVLTRNNESVSGLTLPKKNTKINFNWAKHSKKLDDWIKKSKEYLANKPNNEMLIYAFEEYRLILERLKNKKWRKIMSLDQYTFNIKKLEEQKKMYAFMCEANEKLNDYLYEKLYEDIVELFPERKRLALNNKDFKEFTKEHCRKWFKQIGHSDKYQDIGFLFYEKYFFALGKNNISYGLCDEGWNIKTSRKKLQTNTTCNLFDIIDDLRKFVDK